MKGNEEDLGGSHRKKKKEVNWRAEELYVHRWRNAHEGNGHDREEEK